MNLYTIIMPLIKTPWYVEFYIRLKSQRYNYGDIGFETFYPFDWVYLDSSINVVGLLNKYNAETIYYKSEKINCYFQVI